MLSDKLLKLTDSCYPFVYVVLLQNHVGDGNSRTDVVPLYTLHGDPLKYIVHTRLEVRVSLQLATSHGDVET